MYLPENSYKLNNSKTSYDGISEIRKRGSRNYVGNIIDQKGDNENTTSNHLQINPKVSLERFALVTVPPSGYGVWFNLVFNLATQPTICSDNLILFFFPQVNFQKDIVST